MGLKSDSRSAFTLTELLAVLVIMGLLASASLYAMSTTLRRTERVTSLESFKGLLAWARDRSHQNDVDVTFDLDQQTVAASDRTTGQDKRHRCSGGLKLEGLVSLGMVREQGTVTARFTRGMCQTLAIKISSPALQSTREQWLVVCGPSGEILQYDDAPQTGSKLLRWLSQRAQPN